MLFSIVVPTYNRAHLIEPTLRSLLKQEFPDYEIIVVDDGSEDATDHVVAGINSPKIRYYKRKNAERAASRNFGVTVSLGRYINFFDSDDIALPHHLSIANSMIVTHSYPDWFYLGCDVINQKGERISWATLPLQANLRLQFVKGNPLATGGVFLRRDIALTHRFNEERKLSGSEDYELWLRLIVRYPLYFANNVTNLLVEHPERSVHLLNGQKLVDRIFYLRKFIAQDSVVKAELKNNYRVLNGYLYSHLVLHLSEYRLWKIDSIKVLFLVFIYAPSFILEKRLLIIIRNILIMWK
jgi:glycosyltransferase involved in cell wall biosynthesis